MSAGNIVILNGASSLGKTSILRALQSILEPHLDAGLDKFLWMLPGRYLNRPLWDEVLGQGLVTKAGPIGHHVISGTHHAIAALARAGNHVIADHTLVDPLWVNECATLFGDLPAFLIGIRCPLEVLEQREKARHNRTPGQARAQFDLVHAHGIYDLEVDTSVLRPAECALAIKKRLQGGSPPSAFGYLRQKSL